MRLSVSIIAKNEAESIVRCLESVQNADEIVVCDTGSEDNTVEVVRKFTDHVFTDYQWRDDFSAARNHALSKCTGDWILVIDADNRLMNPIEEVKSECARADAAGHKTVSLKIYNKGRFSHLLPYLFRRDPQIFFKRPVHNYLTRDDKHDSELGLDCWYSDSHRRDPDRTFRILKKVNSEDSTLVRDKYYLGREYYVRGLYADAVRWFQKYLSMGSEYAAEIAETYLLMARSYWQLQEGDLARETCAKSINVNTHFREAILFMAEMSGPVNRERWLEFAELADNRNVLFHREKVEWKRPQYDEQFRQNADMSRYEEIQKEIARIVGDQSVLDIGCGPGKLAQYVKNYSGFDFSEEAVRIAAHPKVWVGTAYDKTNFIGTDYFVCTEVLEHLDDLKVIENIPAGQKVIFSVPSFDDESHLRMFNEAVLKIRYGALFDFQRITRFNWNGRWEKEGKETRNYILLVEAVKRNSPPVLRSEQLLGSRWPEVRPPLPARFSRYGQLAMSGLTVNAVTQALESAAGRIQGDYYEFGIWAGATLHHAQQEAARLHLNTMQFWGFDSFSGLPEVVDAGDGEVWTEADYSCPRAVVEDLHNHFGVDWNRVHLIGGWYKDTLTDSLVQERDMSPAAVILVDCDMYTSAGKVLRFITPLLQDGTVLLFDDWTRGEGEKRAFREWLFQHPEWSAEDFVFGTIENNPGGVSEPGGYRHGKIFVMHSVLVEALAR